MNRVIAASLLLLATSVMAISDTEKTAVIERCKDQMNQYGAAMVKACVDQDLEAYEQLQVYSSQHEKIVGRCTEATKQFGWSMIKACVDQDIEARQTIVNNPEKYRKNIKILTDCANRMGQFGWVMIKACTDQDIEAEQALSQY